MKFWDSSAVVALLVAEASSVSLRELCRSDKDMILWWGTPVECASAVARSERNGVLTAVQANSAFQRLRFLLMSSAEINPSERVRDIAVRLLRTHTLRAGDALQLAAALVAADNYAANLAFVCLDERLRAAAGREGLAVIP